MPKCFPVTAGLTAGDDYAIAPTLRQPVERDQPNPCKLRAGMTSKIRDTRWRRVLIDVAARPSAMINWADAEESV